MVRVFLGFAGPAHREAVIDALRRSGPLPDAELVVHPDDGVHVECHGYDLAGAELLVQGRLWSAMVGSDWHPDAVQLLVAPERPGEQ